MSETPQQAYISKVHLKGYKSIKDLEIDFKPGLNIIIGPNGSGKTNFLEFLNLQANQKYLNEFLENSLTNFETEIIFFQKIRYNEPFQVYRKTVKIENSVIKNRGNNIERGYNIIIYVDNNFNNTWQNLFQRGYKLFRDGVNGLYSNYADASLKEELINILSFTYLTFNNPLSESLKRYIEFNVQREKYQEVDTFDENGANFGIQSFYLQYAQLINSGTNKLGFIEKIINNIYYDDNIDTDTINNSKILESLLIPEKFIEILSEYTPISNLVFDTLLSYEVKSNNLMNIDNVSLKFYINESWIKWSDLSDGTKRIFYLIGSVYFSDTSNIVLLEEPELGIHPDQLHKLMDFLKEQSKEKQIIITTHSPEVLNILSADELDRIIVTRHDAEKGTIMRKLTEKQAKDMGERIKEGDMFLSERWVHMNLEDDIFNAQNDEKH